MSTYILLLLLVCMVSCGRKDDADFSRIDALCDSDPRLAMSMLDSIDPHTLSEGGRHRYDLLTIKSRDKAYVCHTSDSLILDVIDYYSSHGSADLYAESLYYGGRVYSDLGDLPTALEYFQKSLDRIPDNKNHLKFKGNVLSQTGRLLNCLKMTDQATEYIKKSIECSTQLNDSAGLFYDNILLAGMYFNSLDILSAKFYFKETQRYSQYMDDSDRTWLMSEYALLLLSENKIDSALNIIRPLPYLSDSLCTPRIFSIASEIYRNAGILDTAYVYAKRVVSDKDPNKAKTGFQLMFSSSLNGKIPRDSLVDYVNAYRSTIDTILYRQNNESLIIQNSQYNYSRYLRMAMDLSRIHKNLILLIVLLVIILVVIIYIILRLRKSNREKKARLAKADVTESLLSSCLNSASEDNRSLQGKLTSAHKTISVLHKDLSESRTLLEDREARIQSLNEDLTEAQEKIEGLTTRLNESNDTLEMLERELQTAGSSEMQTNDSEETLKIEEEKRILLTLFLSSIDGDYNPELPEEIQEASVYIKLQSMLKRRKPIPRTSLIWNDIYQLVESVKPFFVERLRILTSGQQTRTDFETCLLIGLGFSPSQTGILCGISKSSVSSRRVKLCKMIFNDKKYLSRLDSLIRWL